MVNEINLKHRDGVWRTFKQNTAVMIDNIGTGIVWKLKVEADQIEVGLDEPGANGEKVLLWVETNRIRPRAEYSEYEIKRYLRMIDNERKMAAPPPVVPSKPAAAGKAPAAAPPKPAQPPPARNVRETTRPSAAPAAPPPPPRASDPPPARDTTPPQASAPAAAQPPSGDGSADADPQARTQALVRQLGNNLKDHIDNRFESVRKDLRKELRTGPARIYKKGSKERAEATKAARRTKGIVWTAAASSSDDRVSLLNMDAREARRALQPFIVDMLQICDEVMIGNITPNRLQLDQEILMKHSFESSQGYSPSAADLLEFVEGGRYRPLREAVNYIWRDLRQRFFSKITDKFGDIIIADGLHHGELHSVDTLFSVFPSADGTLNVTPMEEYGVNNRRSSPHHGDPFTLPRFGQYLPAWAEITKAQSHSTGAINMVPFVGGPILDGVIRELNGMSGDDLVPLDFLAVAVAYVAIKQHNLNLNEGVDLRLASLEWKKWIINPETRKKGPIVGIVKAYIAQKKAQREQRHSM